MKYCYDSITDLFFDLVNDIDPIFAGSILAKIEKDWALHGIKWTKKNNEGNKV